jgi:hypothetical protein
LNDQTERSRKQLAAWLRKRFEGRVPKDTLDSLSDEDLCRQYDEDRARKVKLIADKVAANKDKTVAKRSGTASISLT